MTVDPIAANPITVDPITVDPTDANTEQIEKSVTAWPTKNLPKQDLSEKDLPGKLPLAKGLSFSKRGRRRHRRRVFKPKRRGRPGHMLPGGSR